MRFRIKSLLWVTALGATGAAAFGAMAVITVPWTIYLWLLFSVRLDRDRTHYPKTEPVLVWLLILGSSAVMAIMTLGHVYATPSPAPAAGRAVAGIAFAVLAIAPAWRRREANQ